MDWYGVFDRTAGLDSTASSFQHNQMPQLPQSNMVTMGSFDLLTSMPDILPITWFPIDQPIDHHFYSNKPPSSSYEQVVNPGIYTERSMMESRPNLPQSLVNQYQNPLWPTSEERGSNPETLPSNSDLDFFKDNGLTTYFELYTPSESSAETHSPSTTASTPGSSKSQPSNKQRQNSRRDHKSLVAEKRRESTTALVSIPVRCMACKASRIAVCSLSTFKASNTSLLIGFQCVGPPGCKRCQLKCIPGQMYTTIDLSEVLNFDKCS